MKQKLLGLATLVGMVISLNLGMTAYADTIYTVKEGDTLSQIVAENVDEDANLETIAKENKIEDINLIFVGQKLKITSEGEVTEATTEEVAETDESAVPAEPVVEEKVEETEEAPTGRQLTVETTAYDGISLGGVTASGYVIQGTEDKVIAVDPSVIPLGSRVYVPGYGTAIAADTGGAIQGNIIDLNMSTGAAIQWGRQTVTITIL